MLSGLPGPSPAPPTPPARPPLPAATPGGGGPLPFDAMSLPSVKPGFGRLELDADMPGGGRTAFGSAAGERGLPAPEPEADEEEEPRARPPIAEESDPGPAVWCCVPGPGRPWEPRGGRPFAIEVVAEPPSGGRAGPREAIWVMDSG